MNAILDNPMAAGADYDRAISPHPAHIERTIERNVKAHTVDGYTAWHMVADAHAKTIRLLAAELAVLQGHGQTPQRGSQHARMCLGDADVLVEYEYIGSEEPIYDADHPGVGPGHDAEVNILNVLINGRWCDAEDVVPDLTLESWRQDLIEQCAEADADDHEEAFA